MSTILKINEDLLDAQGIGVHPAFRAGITGLQAQEMLRNEKTPFLYILRAGECENNYYVTFLTRDLSVKHQPFNITENGYGWSYQNWGPGGPFNKGETIDDVIHMIMHCGPNDCTPFLG